MRPSIAKQTSGSTVVAVSEHEVSVAKAVTMLHVLTNLPSPNIDGGIMDDNIRSGLAVLAMESSTALLESFNQLADMAERNLA
jgi:hypothetical protein